MNKQQKIAQRAYYKFLERGAEHRHDMDDWITAEKEVQKVPKKSPAKKTVAAKRKTK